MQHFVARDRRHHQRNRRGLDQFALRVGRAGAGGEFLLDLALAIELREHVVEADDQPADLVAAAPLSAPRRVVAGAAHLVGHLGQMAQRAGDLPRDEDARS